ncbi:OmpA family protein [Altericroceibacterium xinjiangense]|uniref:OmpA family protein n=1 Tax=Altericroceibacterium xinjiangense TaxID=762261 RepID=UPI001F4941BC|nr:OmpA family protein [Altericroceibacterium xinjiangense]
MAWLWILLALILLALLLWWIFADDDEVETVAPMAAETAVMTPVDNTPMAGTTEPVDTVGPAGTALTAETAAQANQNALQRLTANPDATPRVYFAFDSAELTDGAKAVLDQLVQVNPGARTEGITLAGFADRAGPVPYNQELSGERAEAVKQYLSTKGIAADVIETEAEGERPPLVETGDGVREPLNRRVRIEMGDSA